VTKANILNEVTTRGLYMGIFRKQLEDWALAKMPFEKDYWSV